MILAGDIGGTHTRLACFEGSPIQSQPRFLEVFPSKAHTGLGPIVRGFVERHRIKVTIACFGVAGPVENQRCETSNLPWIVDSRQLVHDLEIPSIRIINDLEANAYGLALLQPSDFVLLNVGKPVPSGNQALISAGTGLGEAGLVVEKSRLQPFPSEGGHVEFGPRDDLEIEMLRYLIGRFGHVSYERVLSGPGLHNIYDFLRDSGRGMEPPWLIRELAQGDPAEVISRNGIGSTCEICVKALNIFVSIYGSEAGNLALKVLATGGLYVGGGIAPRILRKLQEPEFMRSFRAKGRMSQILEDIPVRVVNNEMTALLGAGYIAAETLTLGLDSFVPGKRSRALIASTPRTTSPIQTVRDEGK